MMQSYNGSLNAGPIFEIGPVPFIKHLKIESSSYSFGGEWKYFIIDTGTPGREGEWITETSLIKEVRRFSLNPVNGKKSK